MTGAGRPIKNADMDLAICVRNLPANDVRDVGRFAEDHGYSEVYLPDGAHGGMTDAAGKLTGRDAMVGFAAMFAGTSHVRGTLGVASVPMHHRLVLPVTASTLYEMSGGRFSLGLGVSHPEQTARFGVPFPEKPVEYMRSWVRELKARSAAGMLHGSGWAVHIAALGPRMLALGAEEADGVILNWLTPEYAATSVDKVRQSARGASPRVALYLRLMNDDTARADAQSYDAMANYHRNFLAQGITTVDDIVARTTVPSHDLSATRARLDEYRAAGIDTICLYPKDFGADNRRLLEQLTRR